MSIPVSVLRCDTYEYDQVHGALERSIQNLGGFSPYIKPGERVLLKVNLLAKKKPEEAVTTHPVFVRALADLLIAHGAKVIIGDSPGGPFTSGMMGGIYKASGIETAARESGATLNQNFDSFEKENPKGLIMKRLTLTDMLNDADKIISVAKLKTHGMMTYTGATKNMFGTVPGVAKVEYHLNMPDYNDFADALIDICLCADPVLAFMDGIVSMEGDGPSAGTPVNTQVVLASPSPFHLDLAACRIIGLSCDRVPLLKRLAARGMIREEMNDIDFKGDPLQNFIRRNFTIPDTSGGISVTQANLPPFIKKFIASHVQTRPAFDTKLCTGCGVCKESCPAKVINISDKKASASYQACIRCYCCQELCPQKAIKIIRPRLSKLMRL